MFIVRLSAALSAAVAQIIVNDLTSNLLEVCSTRLGEFKLRSRQIPIACPSCPPKPCHKRSASSSQSSCRRTNRSSSRKDGKLQTRSSRNTHNMEASSLHSCPAKSLVQRVIETMCMKGLVMVHLGEREAGIALIKDGMRRDLQSHICWHVWALIQKGEHNYEEALKSYTMALKIDKVDNHACSLFPTLTPSITGQF